MLLNSRHQISNHFVGFGDLTVFLLDHSTVLYNRANLFISDTRKPNINVPLFRSQLALCELII